MTDITLNQQAPRRFNVSRVRNILVRPRQEFQEMTAESRASWLTPMLIAMITAFLVVVVAGYLKSRATMLGDVPLPRDWQYWTPEMQQNYMRAQQATQGPVFLYVIPLVSSLTGLWLGWLLLAALLHFGSTLLGGRGSMQSALNVVAWAGLPFIIRDILRIIFMLVAGHGIVSPGLSGFSSSTGFLFHLLTRLDIFMVWNLILLVIGFAIVDSLPRGKSVAGVLIIVVLVLLAQVGLGTLTSGFGGLAVQRPFF